MNTFEIQPAKLLSSKTHIIPGQLRVDELFFQVPLNYSNSSSGTITLFARRANKHEVPVCPPEEEAPPKPYMVYLEGGPGFGNREPQEHPLTRPAISRGYQCLFIDHRGTGLSTPVSTEMLRLKAKGTAETVKYLKLMRQDNTVRDCEAVRKCLTESWPDHKKKWSIFGQSYGGFISLSYLSMHPAGLREVFLTGGLAPVGKSADQVYQATFARTARRNEQYFQKFPEDKEALRQIISSIEDRGGSVDLPAGGSLTTPRLLTIGLAFGAHGGFDNIHHILLHLKSSLDQFGYFTRASLQPLEALTPFDTNIIYAILHEAIYCDGPGSASNWAAHRVGQSLSPFSWLKHDEQYKASSQSKDYFFSGEMIFPLHFQTFPELLPLGDVAKVLAACKDWPPLYDEDQLQKNEVPVYAASYVEDMYVDYQFAKETAAMCRGTKTFESNMLHHNAVRAKTEEVMHNLFNLRDDVLD